MIQIIIIIVLAVYAIKTHRGLMESKKLPGLRRMRVKSNSLIEEK
jgi:hypothetical protein